MKWCRNLVLALAVTTGSMLVPAEAEAGPLLDWLRGCRGRCRLSKPCNTGCNTCQTGCADPNAVAANPYGLQPGQCATTCNQVCSRTVVNYVPHTAYRCSWERVPVTQYRPVTNSDPCTGCSVTCMKPCTTYSWAQRQVPYTTYRPVYRTENYSVPVTTISTGDTGCSTCNTGCNTCGVPGDVVAPGTVLPNTTLPPASGAPVYGQPLPGGTTYPYPVPGSVVPNVTGTSMVAPGGTLGTSGSYSIGPAPAGNSVINNSGVPTPADTVPSLQGINPQTMQRPILDALRGTGPDNGAFMNQQRSAEMPGGMTVDQVSRRDDLRREWGYTPVRLASHSSDAKPESVDQPSWSFGGAAGQVRTAGGSTADLAPVSPNKVNSDWRNAGW